MNSFFSDLLSFLREVFLFVVGLAIVLVVLTVVTAAASPVIRFAYERVAA